MNLEVLLFSHTTCYQNETKVITIFTSNSRGGMINKLWPPYYLWDITNYIIGLPKFKVQSMDDNCGEWVECMGVVSRRWVWLVGVGGIYGCGCKEVYRFPHTTYPYSSCICSFLQQHLYFLLIFLYILHCTVVITLGNLASIPSLVYMIL